MDHCKDILLGNISCAYVSSAGWRKTVISGELGVNEVAQNSASTSKAPGG